MDGNDGEIRATLQNCGAPWAIHIDKVSKDEKRWGQDVSL